LLYECITYLTEYGGTVLLRKYVDESYRDAVRKQSIVPYFVLGLEGGTRDFRESG
jgi:hypothetical protein